MRIARQCLLLFCLAAGLAPLLAQLESEKAGAADKTVEYEPLNIRRSRYPADKVDIPDAMREDFADNAAILAANKVAIEGRTPKSLAEARRLLSLALQLNPRNKRAVVTNFQLGRHLKPTRREPDYSMEVFAGLLQRVGRDMEKAGGELNIELAGALLSLAVDLNPGDEDIIYAHSLYEIDHGKFDWNRLEQQAPLPPRQPGENP